MQIQSFNYIILYTIENSLYLLGLTSFLRRCQGLINQSLVVVIEIWHTHTHKMVFNKFLASLPETDQSVSSSSDRNLAHTHTLTHTLVKWSLTSFLSHCQGMKLVLGSSVRNKLNTFFGL